MIIKRDFYFYYMCALAIVPVLCIHVPRFMAFGPALIGLGGYSYLRYRAKLTPLLSREYLIWCFIIGALWIFSALFSDYPVAVLEEAMTTFPILILGVFFVSVPSVFDLKSLERWLWLFPLGITLGALLASIELLTDMPLYRLIHGVDFHEHLGTAVMNRGIVDIVLCSFAGFAYYMSSSYYASSTKLKYLFLCGIWSSLIILLILTQSQSAQLAFVIGAGFWFLFLYRYTISYKLITGIICIFILIAPWLAQWMFSTFASHIETSSWLSAGYAASRMEIWDFVSRYALESPYFGHGMEAVKHVKAFDHQHLYHKADTVLHPHNFALQLWAEFGLIGVFLGCALITRIMMIFKNSPESWSRIALSTFMATLTVSATGYGLWQGWWLGEFVFLIGLLAILTKTSVMKTSTS